MSVNCARPLFLCFNIVEELKIQSMKEKIRLVFGWADKQFNLAKHKL